MLTAESLLADLPGPDQTAAHTARERQDQLTKPPGSLGRLEEIVIWLSAWQGKHPPSLDSLAIVFAANHGIAADGVSAYPSDVTAQMVANFEAGGAAINALSAHAGANLTVIPISLDEPTRNFTKKPAMTHEELTEAVRIGAAAISEEADILLLGEMGIGNTTAAAALACALFSGRQWTGSAPAPASARMVRRKSDAVEAAQALHGVALDNPLEALRRVGGHELAAIMGATLEARRRRIPVLLDGFVSTAAASVLFAHDESALDHCLVSHLSSEAGHHRLLEQLGQEPILDLQMRLGEASGAAVALSIVRAALAMHFGMATFAEAGIAGKSDDG